MKFPMQNSFSGMFSEQPWFGLPVFECVGCGAEFSRIKATLLPLGCVVPYHHVYDGSFKAFFFGASRSLPIAVAEKVGGQTVEKLIEFELRNCPIAVTEKVVHRFDP